METQSNRGEHQPGRAARLSRRTFVGMAAVTALAGCAPVSPQGGSGSGATPAATRQPTPAMPKAPLSPANAAEIRRLAVYSPNDGQARGIAWSPDGRLLAAGCDEDIYLWDMKNPAFQARWRGHTAQIFGMAWSPDGKRLASACSDGTTRLWEYGQTQAVQVLHDPDGATPVSVAWSPDSSRLACGTFDGFTLIWNATSGERVANWSGPPMVGRGRGGRYPFAVWGVSWSPNGHTLATTRYDGYIQLWDIATGHARVFQKTDYQPNTIAWSPAGDRFATSDDQGKAQLWNPATGEIVTTMFEHSEGGWAYALAWSPDGQLLAVTRASGLVQVWSVADGRQRAALQGHSSSSWGLGWSPDDLRFASGGDDATVCVWGV